MTQTILSLRWFALHHDDLPAFHAGYLVLTVLIAAMLNMGAFAVLILLHMMLDIVKYRDRHHMTWRQTAEGIVRESLVDSMLLLVGLLCSVYFHHSLGIASVSGMLRAETAIVRVLGTLIPKMGIFHSFFGVMSHLHDYLAKKHARFGMGWSSLERLWFATIGISAAFLIFAPFILQAQTVEIVHVLMEELVPWKL